LADDDRTIVPPEVDMTKKKPPIDLFDRSKEERDRLYRPPVHLEKHGKYVDIPKQPSGLTPMSEIELQGIANRNFAGGKFAWWKLAAYFSAYILPIIVSGTIFASMGGSPISLLIIMPLAAIYLAIVWRGISSKIKGRNRRR
jgi:hypothetical protein